MDIESLKGKLDEAEFSALSTFVTDLSGKVESARNESINGRKTLKAENETLRGLRDRMFEKLGIADVDELDALPSITGQAEAAKQHEAKIKRLERDLADRTEAFQTLSAQRRNDQQAIALNKAMATQEWSDREVAEHFIGSRIVWEEDQPFFRSEDGKLLNLEDGVKLVAQTKPTLVKSRGAGGSGYQHGSGGSEKNPWLKENFNLTEQGRILKENPAKAEQMRSAAGK